MKIGRLVSVDLREVWKHEAADFTQWLAENIETLSDTLDISLEVIKTEQKVDESRFSIDILAEDDDEETVIIENQLEKTDHSHLGQIITYASNMDARTVIWITKYPRQEHATAINWLNQMTDKRFYLVKVEAFRIENSKPAPFFSVICKPSVEAKSIGQNRKEIESVRVQRRARRAASDAIIVPARKDGFDRVFLGEDAWYSIRLRAERVPQLKFIAGYQVSPISAITHVAKIKEIVPSHEDPSKYKVIFDGPALEIKHVPVGKRSKIQGPAYCERTKLEEAATLDELLASDSESPKDEAA
jgi:hypothetical protein